MYMYMFMYMHMYMYMNMYTCWELLAPPQHAAGTQPATAARPLAQAAAPSSES